MNRRPPEEIIGKSITGIVYKRSRQPFTGPDAQIFLVFSDGTSLEIYTSYGTMGFASGLDEGGIEYIRELHKDDMDIVSQTYLDDQGHVLQKFG